MSCILKIKDLQWIFYTVISSSLYSNIAQLLQHIIHFRRFLAPSSLCPLPPRSYEVTTSDSSVRPSRAGRAPIFPIQSAPLKTTWTAYYRQSFRIAVSMEESTGALSTTRFSSNDRMPRENLDVEVISEVLRVSFGCTTEYANLNGSAFSQPSPPSHEVAGAFMVTRRRLIC